LVANVKTRWIDGNLTFIDTSGNVLLKLDAANSRVDMPGTRKIAKVALTAGNANAFAFAWQNPEATKIIIERIMLNLTTAGGTGSSVIDVGIVADATSTADTLIDGLDINQTGLFDNITNKGTNGLTKGLVDENGGTNDYITGKILTANAAALVGNAYIVYFAV
jgi:hypothetical protein